MYNNVTLGVSLYGQCKVPRIGNNVVICCGARILGDVSVGNDCIVAANAVVTHDVPDGCIAAGIPARIIATNQHSKARLWLKKGVDDTTVYDNQ